MTFELGAKLLGQGRMTALGLDNKAGLFVALEALRNCARLQPQVAIFVVSTVQEEVGLRGASTAASKLCPDIPLAIDVTLATDDPGNAESTSVPCLLGQGPCISHGPNTNRAVEKLLIESAQRESIRYQPAPSGKLEGNDSKELQVADDGVATASLSIPEQKMHTQADVIDLEDLSAAIRLTTQFLMSVSKEQELRPFYAD